MNILPLRPEHWPAVRAIYEEGIATRNATFETSVPTWRAWNASHLAFARLVAQDGDEVLGWAALSRVSDRCAYAGVAEVSVYVKASVQGKGIGSTLLASLVGESEANGIWTLTAGIFPENISSIRLHEKAGFRVVGVRERIGKLNGRWRDVLLFERRSRIVGAAGE